jgi:hypothetical protein
VGDKRHGFEGRSDMFGLSWNAIFQASSSFLKWRRDREAMELYEKLLSDQNHIPVCLSFSPSHPDDRRLYENLAEKGLLERSQGSEGHYQIVGRG